jgi:putative flippase GtrA
MFIINYPTEYHFMVQFFKYAFVGLLSNFIAFFVYLFIAEYWFDHKTAMTIVYVLGVIQTYIFNKNWTFSHSGKTSLSFARYAILYFIGYLINLSILIALVDFLEFPHSWVQGFAILFIAIFLFVGQKFWVFSSKGD